MGETENSTLIIGRIVALFETSLAILQILVTEMEWDDRIRRLETSEQFLVLLMSSKAIRVANQQLNGDSSNAKKKYLCTMTLRPVSALRFCLLTYKSKGNHSISSTVS